MAGNPILLGQPISQADFTLLVEVVKALLLVVGAAVSVLIFNRLAKKREQDAELFNELVKPRIEALHRLNRTLMQTASEYLDLLERLAARAGAKVDWNDEARFDSDARALEAIQKYRETLGEREKQFVQQLALKRYELGEAGRIALLGRMKHFCGRVRHLWTYQKDVLNRWREDIEACAPPRTGDVRRKATLLVAENLAAAGYAEIVQLVDYGHDDFVKVIRRKGQSSRYHTPADVDDATGLFRLNPLHEEIRYRLGRVLWGLKSASAETRAAIGSESPSSKSASV